MKYLILLISTTFLVLASAGTTSAEVMSYESYSTGATAFCDNTEQPWNKTPHSIGILIYPELKTETINSWIDAQIAQEKSPLGKKYLQEALDPVRIGNFDGIKSLEIAQNVYHARMNTLFDCAVIESRIKIVRGLQESKALKGKSEILDKLKKEAAKLDAQSKQCLPNEKVKTEENPITLSREVSERMVNTATLQYCHYRKYIGYLESNLNTNNTDFMLTDTAIRDMSQQAAPQDTTAYYQSITQRQLQLRTEVDRAERTIPRAIEAYKEMERTYSAHLLLVIVYDDYVRLRDNLHRYMSATSQLFEKAYNAMTP